jgi:HipA-like protein
MTKELIALLDGRETGVVARDNQGKLTFIYDEAWRNAADAYPPSISMPVVLAEHGNAKIDPFLWGLLPDNEIILSNWAHKFHVSARNAFYLIASVGEDCAGTIQFVQPDRLDAPRRDSLKEGARSGKPESIRTSPYGDFCVLLARKRVHRPADSYSHEQKKEQRP